MYVDDERERYEEDASEQEAKEWNRGFEGLWALLLVEQY